MKRAFVDNRLDDGERVGRELHFRDLTNRNVYGLLPGSGYILSFPCNATSSHFNSSNGYNPNMLALTNYMRRGYDRDNFVGDAVCWERLEIIFQPYFHELNPVSDSELVHIVVVWDKQPPIDASLVQRSCVPWNEIWMNEVDGNQEADLYSHRNMATSQRFEVLAEKWIAFPTAADALNGAGTLNVLTSYERSSPVWSIDLRGRRSTFEADEFPRTYTVCTYGAIYLYFRSTAFQTYVPPTFTASTQMEVAWKARLYYYSD